MLNRKLTIGLFGYGVVGEGLYKVIQQTPSLQANIKKICIKNLHKKRNAPSHLFTTDKHELLNDPEINIIVEAISDTEAGFDIISTAMLNGKAVVSASKKVIAENLQAFLDIQEKTSLPLLYEAAACASIPVIRNLEEYYDNDLLQSFSGIVNGSTNYILTKIFEDKLSFKEALLLAQQLGFAEADPSLDVNGYDALNKTVILLLHAFGLIEKPEQLLFNGIQNIQQADIQVANEKGYTIKLVSQAKKLTTDKIAALVLPQFIEKTNNLYNTKNEYNSIIIESSFADQQFFYGKGAGSLPTASALLSDISALRYDYKYEYKKWKADKKVTLANEYYLRVYLSFQKLENIALDTIENIEESYFNEERKYVIGTISSKILLENDWWKKYGNSLLLMPDAFVEDLETKKIKKQSVELANAAFL